MKIIVPHHIDLPRKRGKDKRIHLSANVIVGLHWKLYQDAKHAVHKLIARQLDGPGPFLALKAPVKATCTMFTTGERVNDVDNAWPALKFASDSIVELGYLRDDSTRYVKEVHFLYGGVDNANPRYEILYEEL